MQGAQQQPAAAEQSAVSSRRQQRASKQQHEERRETGPSRPTGYGFWAAARSHTKRKLCTQKKKEGRATTTNRTAHCARWHTVGCMCGGVAMCNGNYRYMSGTSMATPAVAGAVVCLMAADPSRVCSTKNAIAAQRLADAMTSDKSPRRRSGDLPITQKIFYVPHDRQVACPDTSF